MSKASVVVNGIPLRPDQVDAVIGAVSSQLNAVIPPGGQHLPCSELSRLVEIQRLLDRRTTA